MSGAVMIGQTLDEKYRIERELGRGGMGTVYLATHLGTERPVAVKIISPQFMERPEFVERFRREARAAGRLRHPNVVDVTDFGFASTPGGQVAYLVMEYLDGCTLGEILEEEKNLPVGWTLDILEQVCSAVHEAHEQGIIHRDLKPDNIWLEPNQRGGYTVKVLDFGIAKLEGHADHDPGASGSFDGDGSVRRARMTLADTSREETIHDSISPTLISKTGTIAGVPDSLTAVIDGGSIQLEANGSEKKTAIIQPLKPTDQDTVGTRIFTDEDDNSEVPGTLLSPIFDSQPNADLTRVGAVLGTPLYMSPEQCRGEKLDPRSDVYSIGIIAYQMLSGGTPFKGDFSAVMDAHRECAPPPLKTKKVRKKLKRVIVSALSKEPEVRPQTAEAFASILRSRSEGINGLLRRAAMIYTEHMSKFLMLSTFFFLPTIFLTIGLIALHFLKATEIVPSGIANVGIAVDSIVMGLLSAFCAYLIIGTITWIVTQSLAVPLRPIKLRDSLKEARKKWMTFAGTGIFSTLLTIVAGIAASVVGFFVPFLLLWLTIGIEGVTPLIAGITGIIAGFAVFIVSSLLVMLVGPVVMMENMRGWQALNRSATLIRRSSVTALSALFIMFLIPAVSAGLISFVVKMTAKALDNSVNERTMDSGVAEENAGDKSGREWNWSFDNNRQARAGEPEKDMQSRVKDTVLESLLQILLLPLQIIVTSFTAIIVALLYLKTRQAGGESLHDLFSKFEEADQPRKKWQERVRQRLIQSGRITSKSN